MKEVTFFELDYDEYNDIVNEHISSTEGEYCFAAVHEISNDTDHAFHDVVKKELSKWDTEKIKDDDLTYAMWAILQHLVNIGAMPEGNILIRVCW